MAKQYKYGREKEEKVAEVLRKRGAEVELSKGSKGAADLKATFKTGTKWNVQVKSSRSTKAASPSAKDAVRLKESATKSDATPVVAKVTAKSIKFESLRSGRKLTPPPRKK